MSDCSDNLFRVAIASDHGGADLKIIIKEHLESLGYRVTDFGVKHGEKSDYPDQAVPVVEALINGAADRGVLLCGTGVGISIAANRFPGIRAALCRDEFTARMSRAHNDSNVLVLGGRVLGAEAAKSVTDVWLNTEFEGGRHTPRIEKIDIIAENFRKK